MFPKTNSFYFTLSLSVLVFAFFFYQHFYKHESNGDCLQTNILDARLRPQKVLGECFFADDYSEARDMFVDNAKAAGARMTSMSVTHDREYVTDVAILDGRRDTILFHISGTHGSEGFSGSAIQSAYLSYYASVAVTERQQLPTMVLVHANNAYGFANNRRFTAENVDLNRNFLTEEEFKNVKARDPNFAGYIDFYDILNPKTHFSANHHIQTLCLAIKTGFAILQYGMSNMKRAMVSGNYHTHTALFFGGYELTAAAKNLINLVTVAPPKDLAGPSVTELLQSKELKDIIMVDVHTGLGPSGVDTLSIHNPKAMPLVADIYPTELGKNKKVIGGLKDSTGDGSGALSGYENVIGGVFNGFCGKWLAPQVSEETFHKLCITQEYGTIPAPLVGMRLVNENFAYNWGDEEEKRVTGEALRDAFFVNTVKWKKSVVDRGLKVIFQSLDYLQNRKQ